ncbi:MAG: DsrE family protein [Betaproteobacteria bacterium]|nr:DsrE family protein [Betaproteobacteria bacterium]
MGFHSSKMPRFALFGLGGVFLALIAILPGDFKLALVFHDGATEAVLSEEAYGKHQNHTKNSALPLIRQLKNAGVEVFVCGQALAHHGFALNEVAPEVTVAVSALTVLTNRQMDGYGYLAYK